MCKALSEVLAAARALVAAFDADALTASEAASSFRAFAELENLAAAGKLLTAPKVAESDAWAREGHRSAVEWMARTAGTSIGSAKAVAETAKRVEQLPATSEAVRSGGLSLTQVAAVSEAAMAAPESESELLELAERETVRTLQEKARRLVLDSRGSIEERYARQRKLRSFSTWTDDEGMTAGRFRLTAEAGAALVNKIKAEADRQYRRAYREGRRDSAENYAADALVGLVTGQGLIGTKSPSKGSEVVVLVSHESLKRGAVDATAGEICEVPGFGAVPVSVARAMLPDAFLKAVVHEGTRVSQVKHFGRHRPAELATALTVRTILEQGAVRCDVDGCDRTDGMEWDHVLAHAKGGPTSEKNLRPLCRFHHREKTAGRLVPENSRWVWAPDRDRSPP